MTRLEAALQALRDTKGPDESATVLGAKCLSVVIEHLLASGLSKEDLRPLEELRDVARDNKVTAPEKNRRKGAPPSDALLGRVAAIIDLLVKAGYEEQEAAQAIMRRLVAAGVSPPVSGGDARGWKRLLVWRSHLLHGVASEEAVESHKEFTAQLEEIPASERVRAVLEHQIWDRRRKPKA
ncbi:hypothetical protein V6C03_13535 [Methyloligella sp. 2.7D]|uniref:hypothetical protein n=1 Tax=unclassified Methyloligella TaxID=2625955 RepID=UPI00157C5414|nr:hypothetical protein [Methyloligella sp. GL2]QKP77210.1 hypothetical protein HT051_06925 [Methyloligella sp. GL2]